RFRAAIPAPGEERGPQASRQARAGRRFVGSSSNPNLRPVVHRVTSSRRAVYRTRGRRSTAPRAFSRGAGVRRHGCTAHDPSSRSRLPMLAQAIRELRRHAVRSALTAGGIAIGVTALVLLGALSEKTSRLVEGGRDFGAGQITVSGAGGDVGTGLT